MKNSIIKPFWILLFFIFLIWERSAAGLNSLILPSIGESYQALKEIALSGILLESFIITLRRTLIAYGLAVILGIITALLLYRFKFLQRTFRPLITVIQATPPVVWVSLAVVWFGVADDLTPIFLIFIVSLPVIFVNIFQGLEDMNVELVEMAQAYSTPRYRILKEIYLPSLLPALVSALSIAFAFAWKSSVFAEFIASSSGIGYQLSRANSMMATDRLFAWTIVLILFMLFVEYYLLEKLKKHVSRWKND
ncbi:MAG: NitT/TauT family transport system permease protein [Halanaerobium sp. 4-GBenrich]|jgi:NitT/TauT family transport system permease protein|uniref:NitT/TauT family transport system permease protein n=1 Tax=Halanaerobium congolense TaxID=54121 RepID=A0A1G6M0E6_9FIRM|nr:ABC transporter permease [Halanaerobium congolense]ODS50659.1 MAG: NitT/TauT family transport system permease protein [Halanaerobium sp. 4-GBenrich]PXV67296.1 NitT/TauT family transport system permease protein [Halanaerobium congolense]TDP16967.1 NitT/TauT family transport system permease protein [Halanaerobium congolense]TDS34605.1 NitT/TauT family transport system permease protein [Halanaerobium congolense]TDX47888.1 NitT/TauT family transport system permease protein [Halanaerobium congol